MRFDPDLVLHGTYHDWLVLGLKTSLALLGTSLLLALPLAIGVALLRLSPQAPLRWLGAAWVEGLRNVPLLAHLLFWYFAAPELLPDAWKERLYAGPAEFICASIALGLYVSAYMAEDVRSGIRAIPAVQLEAGRALGLGWLATMRHVVLPQALRITAPPLLSQTLGLWKATSIATVVGVGEMMYQAAKVETATFRSAEAFAFVTAAYLVVSLLISAAAELLQRRWALRR